MAPNKGFVNNIFNDVFMKNKMISLQNKYNKKQQTYLFKEKDVFFIMLR